MSGLMEHLEQLEIDLLDKQCREAEKEWRAAEEKRWATAQLELVRQAKAEAQWLLGAAGVADVSAEDAAVTEARVERPRGLDADWRRSLFGDFAMIGFLPPDHDPETGEIVYDVRTVSGRRNNRLRAWSAACVYGPRLKASSLAAAIFATGDTKASGPESVQSSLGGLVRYGSEWRREPGGWLVYAGEGLAPNREMILQFTRERNERQREANQV